MKTSIHHSPSQPPLPPSPTSPYCHHKQKPDPPHPISNSCQITINKTRHHAWPPPPPSLRMAQSSCSPPSHLPRSALPGIIASCPPPVEYGDGIPFPFLTTKLFPGAPLRCSGGLVRGTLFTLKVHKVRPS